MECPLFKFSENMDGVGNFWIFLIGFVDFLLLIFSISKKKKGTRKKRERLRGGFALNSNEAERYICFSDLS